MEVRKMERVIVFIDGAYMLAACSERNVKYDLFKLIPIVQKDRKIIRSYYYDGIYSQEDARKSAEYMDKREKKISFIKNFIGRGITPRLSTLKFRGDKPIQKGVDVRIATDMLMLAARNAYDVAILVSGDEDLVEVVREIKYLGKRVEIVAFRKGVSENLELEADSMWYLEDIWEEVKREE
jgi:uncharacterized LabA/DUF88 family protein